MSLGAQRSDSLEWFENSAAPGFPLRFTEHELRVVLWIERPCLELEIQKFTDPSKLAFRFGQERFVEDDAMTRVDLGLQRNLYIRIPTLDVVVQISDGPLPHLGPLGDGAKQ